MKYTALILFCLTFFTASAQQQFSVYFDSNKFDLKKTESAKLESWMTAHKDDKIVAMHGFTDEDGTSGFNDTLAQKRVAVIFNTIQGKIKI